MKNWLQSIGLVLGSSLVMLLLLELLVRLFVPQQLILLRPDIWRPDEQTGYRRAANLTTQVNWGERTVHLFTDDDGYRVDGEVTSDQTEVAVVTIGDSFLEALQVENEQTVSRVIRSLIEQQHRVSARVDNASAGGWNPNHYRQEALRALAKRSYDLGIVFLFVGNDVVSDEEATIKPRRPTIRHYLRFPKSFGKSEVIDAVLYPVNDTLERRSHLFILFKKSLRSLLVKLGLTPLEFPRVFDIAYKNSPDWDVTTRICRGIQSVFDSYDTPVFFVLLPTGFQVERGRFDDYVKFFDIDESSVRLYQPNEELARRFVSEGLWLVDALECMKKGTADGEALYGSVDVHLNAAGHETLARCLMPMVSSVLFDRALEDGAAR